MSQLTLKRGDTWKRTFTWNTPTGVKDFTDATARCQVRTKDSGIVQLELDTDAGITLGGASGTIAIDTTGIPTTGMNTELCEFDIEITYSDGSIESTPTINLKVEPDITRG